LPEPVVDVMQRGEFSIFVSTCIVVVACAAAGSAWAASEEIQVYLDDKEGPGQLSLDLHNNYVISGRTTPLYVGEQPPNHVYRLTPELNIGLTDTLELGIYFLTTHSAEFGWTGDGAKVRLKYIAPHEDEGPFWGLNLEVGDQALRVSPNPWNAQLKGILGTHSGPWTLGLNLNADTPLNRGFGPTTAALDVKVSHALTGKTQVGFESYNQLGPWTNLDSLSSNSKMLYAVVDTEIAGFDLNAGIGRGLNENSDRWVVKFILGTRF